MPPRWTRSTRGNASRRLVDKPCDCKYCCVCFCALQVRCCWDWAFKTAAVNSRPPRSMVRVMPRNYRSATTHHRANGWVFNHDRCSLQVIPIRRRMIPSSSHKCFDRRHRVICTEHTVPGNKHIGTVLQQFIPVVNSHSTIHFEQCTGPLLCSQVA